MKAVRAIFDCGGGVVGLAIQQRVVVREWLAHSRVVDGWGGCGIGKGITQQYHILCGALNASKLSATSGVGGKRIEEYEHMSASLRIMGAAEWRHHVLGK